MTPSSVAAFLLALMVGAGVAVNARIASLEQNLSRQLQGVETRLGDKLDAMHSPDLTGMHTDATRMHEEVTAMRVTLEERTRAIERLASTL